MSDIFQEVDEEVRREQLKKLWERYGNYVVAAAVLVVAGIAAWRAYDWWEAKKAAEAGAAFEAAIVLARCRASTPRPKRPSPRSPPTVPPVIAIWRGCGRPPNSPRPIPRPRVAAYDKIAADGAVGPVLQDLAALRAGALLIDAGSFADARQRLEPLTRPDRTFRHTARELLALAAWRAGDAAAAKRWSDMITHRSADAAATRARVEMLMALVAAESKS